MVLNPDRAVETMEHECTVVVERDGAETDQQASSLQNKERIGIANKCAGLPNWSNLVLGGIIIVVVMLLSLTVMVFYLPRDDELNVVSSSSLHVTTIIIIRAQ